MHDRATGIHRPLEATLLWLEPTETKSGEAQVIASLDHCILDSKELENIRQSITDQTGVPHENILISLSHTHGSGWMTRARSELPGGELIGPYLDKLAAEMGALALQAKQEVRSATMVFGAGRCSLAAHRDFFDAGHDRFVCGFNPDGKADDTLLLARITDEEGRGLGTIVNYACHPTTLAWDNTLISPDWVGAMKELIEQHEGGYCLFLQGASGDLGPREGFVGDTSVADRNGRQVGHAALATLSTLPQAGTEFRYAGPVISGTAIGTWKHEAIDQSSLRESETWKWETLEVELPYRHDLPTLEQTIREREEWMSREQQARSENNTAAIRDCRAQVEQRTRQIDRLKHLVPGRSYPLRLRIGQVGNAIWIFVPGELYQVFQIELRNRFASHCVFVATLTNDWQPGYIPPASSFGYEIYQEVIAATAPGCLETLIEAVSRKLRAMIE